MSLLFDKKNFTESVTADFNNLYNFSNIRLDELEPSFVKTLFSNPSYDSLCFLAKNVVESHLPFNHNRFIHYLLLTREVDLVEQVIRDCNLDLNVVDSNNSSILQFMFFDCESVYRFNDFILSKIDTDASADFLLLVFTTLSYYDTYYDDLDHFLGNVMNDKYKYNIRYKFNDFGLPNIDFEGSDYDSDCNKIECKTKQLYLKKINKFNLPPIPPNYDIHVQTPFNYACIMLDSEILLHFLKYGAEFNLPLNKGFNCDASPFYFVWLTQKIDVVEYMIVHGVNLFADCCLPESYPTYSHHTPLYLIFSGQNDYLIKFTIKHLTTTGDINNPILISPFYISVIDRVSLINSENNSDTDSDIDSNCDVDSDSKNSNN